LEGILSELVTDFPALSNVASVTPLVDVEGWGSFPNGSAGAD
jgi:hypothetical protein